jgi:hypothetical protein
MKGKMMERVKYSFTNESGEVVSDEISKELFEYLAHAQADIDFVSELMVESCEIMHGRGDIIHEMDVDEIKLEILERLERYNHYENNL